MCLFWALHLCILCTNYLLLLKNSYIVIMMKKYLACFIVLLLSFFQSSAMAEDDFFDNYTGIDRAWDGQKPITNQEFEKAIDTIQAKQKKREARQKKRKIRKFSGGGTSLHRGLDPMNEIPELTPLKQDDEGNLLNVPVNLLVGDGVLEKGYYNVLGEKEKDGNIYLSFYQSQYLKGKIKAQITENDYEAEEINFVKLIPYNDEFVKVVYGSLDFNAYAYVRYGE